MNNKGFVGWIIFGIVGIMIIFSLLSIIGGYWKLGTKTVSADNFEKNYEWFKVQETAITQLKTQVCQSQYQVVEYKKTFGDTSKWNSEVFRGYNDLLFVKNGYISKYNSLVAQYNARRSSFIQSFGRDEQTPKEYAEYLDTVCGEVSS